MFHIPLHVGVLCCNLLQLDVVRQDCGRLSTENNQLHDKLIREGERYEALQKQAYQRTKKLESEIAELSYWKQQAISRCAAFAVRLAQLSSTATQLSFLSNIYSNSSSTAPFAATAAAAAAHVSAHTLSLW
jgi:hypothetical protein